MGINLQFKSKKRQFLENIIKKNRSLRNNIKKNFENILLPYKENFHPISQKFSFV